MRGKMSLWSLFSFIVGMTIGMMLFLRYVAFFEMNAFVKTGLFLCCFGIGLIPLLTGFQYEAYLGKFYNLYRYVMYFIFITAGILLMITFVRDLVWTVLHFVSDKFNPIKSPDLMKINIITIILAFVCGIYALYEGVKVPNVKNVEIFSEKVKEEKKIVLLPDLHLHRSLRTKKLEGIVKKVNELNPDAILLVGDVIDDNLGRIDKQLDILKGLKAKNGVFFVTGNHEIYRSYKLTTKALSGLGFIFLENDGVSLGDDLFVGGIPDVRISGRIGIKPDLKETFAKSNNEQYKILMSHAPFNFGKNNFDLEVSGHTHGGQVFPFMFMVYWQNKYVAGLYDLDEKAKLYVSRGAGQWGPQMRFFAPAEISLLKIGNKPL